MSDKGYAIYADILSQARSLSRMGIEGHQLVVVLGYEQERALSLYIQREHDGPDGLIKYVDGMPVHVGPASCCAVISTEELGDV